MEGRFYVVKLSNEKMIEVIIVKTDIGFVGTSEDGFFIGVHATTFESAKNLFVEAYEEFNVLEIVE